jgi:hypothetical protein
VDGVLVGKAFDEGPPLTRMVRCSPSTLAVALPTEPLADLLTDTPAAIVIGEKGFWGRDNTAQLAAAGTTLLTPGQDPHRRQPRPRARTRLDPPRHRERLLEPQTPDAP